MGLIFKTAKQGLGITFQYAPNIFRASGVERFKHNFQQFVKLVLDTPDIQLQQLPDISSPKESVKRLTESEKKQHFLNPL